MNNGNCVCYFVKHKDSTILKFSYDSSLGIYYQIVIKQKCSEKKIVYKESFEYFYVLEEPNGRINVFCQDICGDLILCTLEGKQWEYKTLLRMKYDAIMPIHFRAFFHLNNIDLLYNIIDKNTYSEVLVHQIAVNRDYWGKGEIITKLDYCHRAPYGIFQIGKSNLIILNTISSGGYQLISRNFHIIEGWWGKQEVIYTSALPFIDFNVCGEENRMHYLFITQESQFNRVIYHYKDIGEEKNIILFQNKKIDSCLLILYGKMLWALWICKDNLYACHSENYGQNFSIPRVYKHFKNEVPVKAFYQEYSDDKKNEYISHDIYVLNINGEEQLFLQDLLESFSDKNNDLKVKAEDSDYRVEELKDCLAKLKTFKQEKEELKLRLKIVEEELERLDEARKYEKNQLIKLQHEFYKEKDKAKLYMNDNSRLVEENRYLENKLLLTSKEKGLIEKKLSQKEMENKELKQQIYVMKNRGLLH